MKAGKVGALGLSEVSAEDLRKGMLPPLLQQPCCWLLLSADLQSQ